MSGTTIGQWARRGYIRASRSAGDPHVYSVEDVVEAAVVHALLERGVRHARLRRAVARLGDYGEWPLTVAPLATTDNGVPADRAARRGGVFELAARGWQRMCAAPPLEDVRLRLRRVPR